jgi:sugar/nucleoside kinase (ribokinase family)
LLSVFFQYPDRTGGNMTTVDSASARLSPQDAEAARPMLAKHGKQAMVLAAPEVPMETRMKLLEIGTECGCFRSATLDSSEAQNALHRNMFRHTDLVALNEEQARAIAGVPPSERIEKLLSAVRAFLTAQNPSIAIAVTFGAQGAFGYRDGKWDYVPACPAKQMNTAGAGDAFLSGLLIATALGLPFISATGAVRKTFAEQPVATAMDFATLLASAKVASPDALAMDLDARALKAHAAGAGVQLSPRIAQLFS